MTSKLPAMTAAPMTRTPPGAIEITVNGEKRAVPIEITVAALLESLGLAGKHVAVERNLQVVPRAQHAATLLAAGDILEVVSLVGGG